MNTVKSMKQIGLLLLALGVALCAAYGARQSPVMFEYIQSTANISASKEATKRSLTTYNKARTAKALKVLTAGDLPTLSLGPKMSNSATIQQVSTYLETLRSCSGPHSDALEHSRKAWLENESVLTKVLQSTRLRLIPTPTERLSGWLAQSGLIFALGLLLIGGGAYLTRRAQTLGTDQSGNDTSEALDVATVAIKMTELSQQVAELSQNARLVTDPMLSDATALKQAIEALQLSHFHPIIDARYRLQAQIGLGSFAEVFSPFSSGERNLNRTWSTLVDEHWSESLSALGRAALSLKRADESLQAILTGSQG
jgi:hypothetical protein